MIHDAAHLPDRRWPACRARTRSTGRLARAMGRRHARRRPRPTSRPTLTRLAPPTSCASTEKFTPRRRRHLEYDVTIDDPTEWSRPWTLMIPLKRTGRMFEFACHEGNYGMRAILSGARAQEKAESGQPLRTEAPGGCRLPAMAFEARVRPVRRRHARLRRGPRGTACRRARRRAWTVGGRHRCSHTATERLRASRRRARRCGAGRGPRGRAVRRRRRSARHRQGYPDAHQRDLLDRSMTKPVTSVAIMMLVEAGKLKIDDRFRSYLDGYDHLQVITTFNDAGRTYTPGRRRRRRRSASCSRTPPASAIVHQPIDSRWWTRARRASGSCRCSMNRARSGSRRPAPGCSASSWRRCRVADQPEIRSTSSGPWAW